MSIMDTSKRKKRAPNTGPSKDELRARVEELQARLVEAEKRDALKVTPGEAKSEARPDEVSSFGVVPASVDSGQQEKTPSDVPAKATEDLPQNLKARIEDVSNIHDALMQEIEAFKAGQAYLEGDLPVYLHGLQGPGLMPGDRRLNWIDRKHLDPRIEPRWSNKRMVDYHRADGWVPMDYDDFQRMVRERGGAYSYTRTPEGHVQCGDLIFIITSRSRYEFLQKRNRDAATRQGGVVKSSLRSQGKKLGMEVDDDMSSLGPKAKKVFDLLRKEFGEEGVRQMFAG